MTKFLSQALQAPEPFFRQALRRLEAASGHPNTDIRFSNDVKQASKDKLRELGLDPEDTTPQELYQALQTRVKADDARLNRQLRTLAATHVSAEADTVAGMIHALGELPDSKRCFSMKTSTLKTILKRVPPKKTMKQLGYRSLGSFLKHEPPILILAAAQLCEDHAWQKRLIAQYKNLQPSDFENRQLQLVEMKSARWTDLIEHTLATRRNNLIYLKEQGALVFLPLPQNAPTGSTIASLSLALHGLNEIRAVSTFLKLCQVRPDFGNTVQALANAEEPRLSSELLDQAVPWRLVQHYYARLGGRDRNEVAEPHLQLDDIAWHPIEDSLAAIESSLKFWQQSGHLGTVHANGPVSLNIVDAALNACNHLPFERRVSRFFHRALHHELMLNYLQPETVERAVSGELRPELARAS